MKGFTAAWLLGEGIVGFRYIRRDKRIPVPGALAGVTVLFLALAVIADVSPAWRRPVTLLAWGLDVAGLLNLIPAGPAGGGQIGAGAPPGAGGGGQLGGGSGGTGATGGGKK